MMKLEFPGKAPLVQMEEVVMVPTWRVAYVRSFGEPSENSNNGVSTASLIGVDLLSAFVSCLNPQEACSGLDLTFEQSREKRRVLLKKIRSDILNDFNECHASFIKGLVDGYPHLPHNKKQTAAYCLAYLADATPESSRDEILGFLLKSEHKTIRRIGYKRLKVLIKHTHQLLAQDIVETLKDEQCAQLAIDFWPIEFLIDNFSTLEEKVRGTRYFTRLYLKIGEQSVSKLENLSQDDEITFVYISLKLGRKVEEESALKIFERNRLDSRLGLLVWCFGQMGLWSVLEYIYSRLDALANEKFEVLRKDPQLYMAEAYRRRFGMTRAIV